MMSDKIVNGQMTFRKFIDDNREEIDKYILRVIPGAKLNNEDRRMWILNDDDLYKWAKRSGVKI